MKNEKPKQDMEAAHPPQFNPPRSQGDLCTEITEALGALNRVYKQLWLEWQNQKQLAASLKKQCDDKDSEIERLKKKKQTK